MNHLAIIFVVYMLAFTTILWGHPGHDPQHEAAERRECLKHNTRSLAHCAADLKPREHEVVNLQRRQDLVRELRQKRGIPSHPRRDLDSVLRKSHHLNDTCLAVGTDPQDLFSDDSSCILQPEVTEGPFYISGELVRRNITDVEKGIDLVLDIQIIDVGNCQPVTDVYVDIWHCNATGVYGGIVAEGNGNSNDASNLDNTALRGLQKTDETGIAQFETIFPGHYLGISKAFPLYTPLTLYWLPALTLTGRTNHIHIMAYRGDNITASANSTSSSSSSSSSSNTHIGQIFFDQDLQALVEATRPYTLNKQALTTNAEDGILAIEASSSDPVMRYILLGNAVSDGVLGWIRVGVDLTGSRTPREDGVCGEEDIVKA